MTLALAAFLLAACSWDQPRADRSPTASPTAIAASSPAELTATPEEQQDRPQVFSSTVAEIGPSMLDHSWRSGCPVPPENLRLITLTHWDFDGRIADGELVVHVDQVEPIISVMRKLFQQGFPIHRMTRIDRFNGDDAASMAANNTSAFNCREVGSQPGVWSQHAFGTAIDVNPVQNPYVPSSGPVEPTEAAAFLDRSLREPGMIQNDDEVVRAFAEIGWEWGGNWSDSKDYQHFSLTGR